MKERMKMRKSLVILLAMAGLFLVSCEKDDSDVNESLKSVEGTYNGEFNTVDGLKSNHQGTAIVTMHNEEQLQIHCFGDLMDTTFIMDAYEHGDSVMICYTGETFEMEYGHMGQGHHMGDMGMRQTEWEHHMMDDHDEDDMHYGGFNMNNHSFSYTFKMGEGSEMYYLKFEGVKGNN